MKTIPGSMTINLQCIDKNGQKGSFLTDERGQQFGNTYKDLVGLFAGHEYKFCKAHGIEVK